MPLLSAIIRDELRRVVAVKAMAIIYSKEQMTFRSMWCAMNELYHGASDKKIISQVDLLIHARPPYSDLFEKRNDLITGTAAVQANCNVLKSEICRVDAPIILGRDITKALLERTSFKKDSALITGKTLVRVAQDSLRNIKKALALISTLDAVQSFTSDGVVCKSGHTELDVKEQLLDKMFELLQGKMSVMEDDEDEPNEVVGEDVTKLNIRPASWFFSGWFALMIFGPFAEQKDRLSLLEIGQSLDDKKKRSGRATSRVAEAKQKDEARANNVGIGSETAQRGVKSTAAFTQQISLANLAVKKEEQDQAEKDSRVFAINAEMKSQTLKIDRLERRATQYGIAYDSTNKLWQDIQESENRLVELEKKLAKISSSPARDELKRSHELIDNLMDEN
jgi:Ethanolamine utilisation protein EutA